jgi:hypothetical protein
VLPRIGKAQWLETMRADSVPKRTKDLEQQHVNAQQPHVKQPVPKHRDLRRCSTPGTDEVIERGKAPVAGKVTSIEDGIVTQMLASDGTATMYRVEDPQQNTFFHFLRS